MTLGTGAPMREITGIADVPFDARKGRRPEAPITPTGALLVLWQHRHDMPEHFIAQMRLIVGCATEAQDGRSCGEPERMRP